MAKYIAQFAGFEVSKEFDELKFAQKAIEDAWLVTEFVDYETAWIYAYNFFGVQTHSYYFSLKDLQWHGIATKPTNWFKWNNAIWPIRNIAKFLLKPDIFAQLGLITNASES
jgi:hypothetical protein